MTLDEMLLNPRIRVDITIKTRVINVKEMELSVAEALKVLDDTMGRNPMSRFMQRNYSAAKASFGFVTLNEGNCQIATSAYISKSALKIPDSVHTCPFNNKRSAMDSWEMRADDKCCSFCGSIHPDRVLELLRQHGMQSVDFNSGQSKGYIQRDDVPNAYFGGLKFYIRHFTMDHIRQYNQIIQDELTRKIG